MAESQRNKSESRLLGKGQRHWGVMLVGEHGRVIPFRRFKEIAVAVLVLACLSLVALVVIAYLYAQQDKTIGGLQSQVDTLRRQTVQLKDEKDVLQAKLVIYEMQKSPEAPPKPKDKESAPAAQKPAATQSAPIPAPTPASEADRPVAAVPSTPQPTASVPATPTSTPSVNWIFDLQRFEAKYDAPRELIKLTVRLFNKTVSKQSFSGRMVLVLKQADQAPRHWVAVPDVPLVEGKPMGSRGQAFTVQNYRGMDFKLYKQRPPIAYNSATVFIFTSSGELLLSRDFHFNLEGKPIPTPKMEAAPTPMPGPALTPAAPATPPSGPTPAQADAKPADSSTNPTPGVGSQPPGNGPDQDKSPTQGRPQTTGTTVTPPPIGSPVPVPEKRPEPEPTGEHAQPKPQGER